MENDNKDGGYEIGYGKPPRGTRFQKGHSGNSEGRPRGSKNLKTLLDEALGERVVIAENGRRRSLTKAQVIIKQLVNQAARGDHRSIQMLLAFIEKRHLNETGDAKPISILDILNKLRPISDEKR